MERCQHGGRGARTARTELTTATVRFLRAVGRRRLVMGMAAMPKRSTQEVGTERESTEEEYAFRGVEENDMVLPPGFVSSVTGFAGATSPWRGRNFTSAAWVLPVG